jgi:hypothetical protein
MSVSVGDTFKPGDKVQQSGIYGVLHDWQLWRLCWSPPARREGEGIDHLPFGRKTRGPQAEFAREVLDVGAEASNLQNAHQ